MNTHQRNQQFSATRKLVVPAFLCLLELIWAWPAKLTGSQTQTQKLFKDPSPGREWVGPTMSNL